MNEEPIQTGPVSQKDWAEIVRKRGNALIAAIRLVQRKPDSVTARHKAGIAYCDWETSLEMWTTNV